MFKSVLVALFVALVPASAVRAEVPIGFKQIEISDAAGDRPLHVGVWYPANGEGPVSQVGENPVFEGVDAIVDARPTTGRHPLVVLSHGYGGSWRNLGWLAAELAHRGYVVAAPDHPGTTTFDKRPEQAARLWERPRDLSRVIDELTRNPSLAGDIEPGRIAAIGHSLGGWTVVSLGGARFSADQFLRECERNASPRACQLMTELGTGKTHTPLEGDLRDKRVGAVVSLDLGLARGFTPASLAAYKIPAFIIAAGIDIGDMPANLESGYLAANMPKDSTNSLKIADAMHFSFMQICKPGAGALIDAETPGDGIVCKDGGSRAEIHRRVIERVVAFLAQSIPQK